MGKTLSSVLVALSGALAQQHALLAAERLVIDNSHSPCREETGPISSFAEFCHANVAVRGVAVGGEHCLVVVKVPVSGGGGAEKLYYFEWWPGRNGIGKMRCKLIGALLAALRAPCTVHLRIARLLLRQVPPHLSPA